MTHIVHRKMVFPANYTDAVTDKGYLTYLKSIVVNSSTVLGYISDDTKVVTIKGTKYIKTDLWYYDTGSSTRYMTDALIKL
jgi:hypothetical protein